eukprot:5756532-Pleurochrysis_carterae.AAC.1
MRAAQVATERRCLTRARQENVWHLRKCASAADAATEGQSTRTGAAALHALRVGRRRRMLSRRSAPSWLRAAARCSPKCAATCAAAASKRRPCRCGWRAWAEVGRIEGGERRGGWGRS